MSEIQTSISRKTLSVAILLLTLGVSMNVFGFLGFGGDSWKEEVLLHDGSTLIVKRSQIYGGRREVGQSAPIKEHTISFALPGSSKMITWTSEFSEDVGRANFQLVAVHVLGGTPYVVTTPNLCLSYNKWGRPNPPYVFFRHDGTEWKRTPLEEFPVEFKTINVTVSLGDHEVKTMVDLGTVLAENIRKANSELRQPEFKGILRTPIVGGEGQTTCPDYNSKQYRSFKAPLPINSPSEK